MEALIIRGSPAALEEIRQTASCRVAAGPVSVEKSQSQFSSTAATTSNRGNQNRIFSTHRVS